VSSLPREKIRILIADDHELARKGIASILNTAHPDWEVCAEAASAEAAIQAGVDHRPDAAIVDLSLPDRNGLELARALLENDRNIAIVVLTMHAGAPISAQLRRLGVKAYLVKSDAPKLLVATLERALAGEDSFFSSEAALRPPTDVKAPEYIPAQFALTPRELDVLRLLVQDKSNRQVAAELQMSVRTAETHHASILAKLNVETLAELMKIALRDKVI